MHYEGTNDVEHWKVTFDRIDTGRVTWRPYMGMVSWVEDLHHIIYVITPMYIINRWEYVIEQYRPDRVHYQFGLV